MVSNSDSFYSSDELSAIGFKQVGGNVPISRKSSIYSPANISISSHVRIDDFCILSGYITLENYIHVAAYSALYGGVAGIIIEDYADISSRVSKIYTGSDDYSGKTITNPMILDAYKLLTADRFILINL